MIRRNTSMSKLKKVLCIFLSLIAAGIFAVTAIAAAPAGKSVSEMKEYLLSIDIPSEFIEMLDEDGIADMYDELYGKNAVFEGMRTVSACDSEVQTRASISEENLKFAMVITSLFPDDEATQPLDSVGLFIAYDWLNIPGDRKIDGIIVGWDADVFTYEANSFGAMSSGSQVSHGVVSDSFNHTYTRPALIGMDSLGYDVKLNGFGSIKPDSLGGYGSLRLLPRQSPMYRGGNYVTSFTAQYRHLWDSGEVEVGFDLSTSAFGLSVVFATVENTSTAAISANYKYRYEY